MKTPDSTLHCFHVSKKGSFSPKTFVAPEWVRYASLYSGVRKSLPNQDHHATDAAIMNSILKLPVKYTQVRKGPKKKWRKGGTSSFTPLWPLRPMVHIHYLCVSPKPCGPPEMDHQATTAGVSTSCLHAWLVHTLRYAKVIIHQFFLLILIPIYIYI